MVRRRHQQSRAFRYSPCLPASRTTFGHSPTQKEEGPSVTNLLYCASNLLDVSRETQQRLCIWEQRTRAVAKEGGVPYAEQPENYR
jgi:hypothetical protein